MAPSSRQSEEAFQSDTDQPTTASLQKHSSYTASPAAHTPEQATTRSSESSQEATEADRREARQLLSQQGAMQKTGWLLLRSTGPNLTTVLRHAGARGLNVHQLYSFRMQPEWRVHCLILLYKWAPDRGDRVRWNPERLPPMYANSMQDDSSSAGADQVILCGQTMDNASATQALIMSALNIPESGGGETVRFPDGSEGTAQEFDIGEDLRALKGFVKPMDPIIRAAALCSADVVRKAHNKAAKTQHGGHPELLDEDGKVRTALLSEELWMYSVFIQGRDSRYIYELESMGEEAKAVAAVDRENGKEWAPLMEKPIMKKITTFREHHTPFLLFAVTSDIKTAVLPRIPRKGRPLPDEHMADANGSTWNDKPEDGEVRNGADGREKDDEEAGSEDEVDEEAAREELKRARAVHDYETFFVEMMKLMASRGDINELIREEEAIPATSSEEGSY